jgi:hypothetical protein
MSYSGYNQQQAGYGTGQQMHHYVPVEVGATFVPGGDDSYYMPEVIAPAPQRSAISRNDDVFWLTFQQNT